MGCMGLTPAYVDILQRHWMRDDLSTITNTYPDHEDLQGPAGLDVATTITQFIPVNGQLYTEVAETINDGGRFLDENNMPTFNDETGIAAANQLKAVADACMGVDGYSFGFVFGVLRSLSDVPTDGVDYFIRLGKRRRRSAGAKPVS